MEKPVIFIHSPKTGGSSITSFFNYSGGKIHKQASFYAHRHPKEFESYLVFSTTRNPWDRVVSCYFYSCENPMGGLTREEHKNKFPTFESYVVALHENFVSRGENLSKPPIHSMFNPINTISDVKMSGKVVADYICNMHTMEHDFELIKKITGRSGKLGHRNASSHRDYREYYTPRSASMVAEIFAEDIDHFGFCFSDETQHAYDKIKNQEKVDRLLRAMGCRA